MGERKEGGVLSPWKQWLLTGMGEVLEVLLVFNAVLLLLGGVLLGVQPCLSVLWR